jgi:hypothetical protein
VPRSRSSTEASHPFGWYNSKKHSETLDYVPGRLKVVRHICEKLSCRVCEVVVAAPAPDHAIARGRAGAGSLWRSPERTSRSARDSCVASHFIGSDHLRWKPARPVNAWQTTRWLSTIATDREQRKMARLSGTMGASSLG